MKYFYKYKWSSSINYNFYYNHAHNWILHSLHKISSFYDIYKDIYFAKLLHYFSMFIQFFCISFFSDSPSLSFAFSLSFCRLWTVFPFFFRISICYENRARKVWKDKNWISYDANAPRPKIIQITESGNYRTLSHLVDTWAFYIHILEPSIVTKYRYRVASGGEV